MQVIIIGMHRTGSSLLASIVMELGVSVGDDLLGTHPSQPKGHFEDRDFYQLNMEILKAAGGSWVNPPSRDSILNVAPRFTDRIKTLIREKNKRKNWGWKDPRTCLTLPLYAPYLKKARFLVSQRKEEAIIASLLLRSGGNQTKWKKLIDAYQSHMNDNLYLLRPKYTVFYERLIDKESCSYEVKKIKDFLGLSTPIDNAVKRVEFR